MGGNVFIRVRLRPANDNGCVMHKVSLFSRAHSSVIVIAQWPRAVL